MFITYDAKDPNWAIWACDYDDNGSIIDAWKNVRTYNLDNDKIEPRLVTVQCSKRMFSIIKRDGVTDDFPWVIKDGIAEYVDNPLKELRQLLLTQNRSQFS